MQSLQLLAVLLVFRPRATESKLALGCHMGTVFPLFQLKDFLIPVVVVVDPPSSSRD